MSLKEEFTSDVNKLACGKWDGGIQLDDVFCILWWAPVFNLTG